MIIALNIDLSKNWKIETSLRYSGRSYLLVMHQEKISSYIQSFVINILTPAISKIVSYTKFQVNEDNTKKKIEYDVKVWIHNIAAVSVIYYLAKTVFCQAKLFSLMMVCISAIVRKTADMALAHENKDVFPSKDWDPNFLSISEYFVLKRPIFSTSNAKIMD